MLAVMNSFIFCRPKSRWFKNLVWMRISTKTDYWRCGFQERQGRIQQETETTTGGEGGAHIHPHQSPAALSTAPCNIHPQPVSRWTSQAAKPARFTPKVLLVLLLPVFSSTALPCLSSNRQICVCQTLQWLSNSDLREALHQPSHSLKEQMCH